MSIRATRVWRARIDTVSQHLGSAFGSAFGSALGIAVISTFVATTRPAGPSPSTRSSTGRPAPGRRRTFDTPAQHAGKTPTTN
ncbi:hypothetical protein ACFYXF_23895 [Streptomyces sp. NPDC002680]|uniref:hypothetical protein n=1 Tax=Streptomyces sp. NPDC002680 TaxID=3364659 RepID=UPI0036BF40E5